MTTTGWLSVIRISGSDRIAFLQGQLTQDLARLSPAQPVALAASCDAKGRVLAVLTLIHRDDHLLALVRADIAERWLQHVLRYRLRAQVTLEFEPALTPSAMPANDAGAATTLLQADATDGDAVVRWRLGTLIEALQAVPAPVDDATWQRGRLRAGVADVGPATSGAFTPHMLGLHELGAISFSKGCYTGQEVVARTEHLGAVKRVPRLVTSSGAVLIEGEDVWCGDAKAGRIAAASGPLAIAVVATRFDTQVLTRRDGSTLTTESVFGAHVRE